MQSERQVLVSKTESEGTADAEKIRSAANRKSADMIAKADAKATDIRGQGEAEAAKSFSTFQKNPDLANFLLRLTALELSLKDRATLILDPHTPPFDLLMG